jgi:hypothetical protein
MEQTIKQEVKLTDQEYSVLAKMNEGMYLVKEGNAEGLAFGHGISNIVKAGTVNNLVEARLVRQVDFVYKGGILKYVLTDKGRRYRNIR